LGPERTQVVITLRPLSRILASQWQQYMQNRMVIGYADWLEAVLDRPGQTEVTPSFWRRHRHDELVRRWAEVAGLERLTVVVVDEGEPFMLVRTFEQMLGLPPGTVRPSDTAANRSLTFPEVEFVRACNAELRRREISEADYTRFVRFGAVRHLQRRVPPPDEPRVLTPAWAAERTRLLAEEIVAGIAESGVRVVGDLASLTVEVAPGLVGDNDPVADVPAEIPARFAAGLLQHLAAEPPEPVPEGRIAGPLETAQRLRNRSELVADRLERSREELGRTPAPAELRTGTLLRLLGGRVAARVRGF
jgi:hypothetical protein